MVETTTTTPFQKHCQLLLRYLPPSKPAIFATTCLTWALCILTLSRCTFFTQSNTIESHDLDMGLFSRAVYDKDGDILGCVAYTDGGPDFIDANFKTGRAFGIIAALCCSIALLFVGVSTLFCPKGCDLLWGMSRLYLAVATLGQMFSFFALNSQHCQSGELTCRLSGAGKLALFNVLVLAALTIKLFWESSPKHPWIHMWSDRLEEETVATDPSGAHQKQQQKESLSIVDPFSAEFVSSGSPDSQENGAFPMHQANPDASRPDLHVWEMEVDPDQHFHNARNNCAHSVASSGSTQQSLQESLASAVGLQNLKSFRLLSMLLLTTCWAISIVGAQRCTLFLVGPEGGDRSDFSGLGLFSRAAYHNGRIIGCLAYPDEATEHFDSSFQISRVFGAITGFLMSVVFALGCLQLFVQVAKDEIWLVIRALLPCATISQLLVFIGYRTETCTISELVECKPGPTGIMVIFNVFLLLVLSIGAMLVPPPPSPMFRFHQHGQVPRVARQQNSCQPQQQRRPQPRPQRRRSATQRGSNTTTSANRSAIDWRHQMMPMQPIPETQQSMEDTTPPPVEEERKEDEEPKKVVRISEEPTETISIRVEFSDNEKKTIKTLTHADGSQTITTTIEELEEVSRTDHETDDDEDSEDEDYDMDDSFTDYEEQQADASSYVSEVEEDQIEDQPEKFADEEDDESPKETPRNMYMEALKKAARPPPLMPKKNTPKNMYLDAIKSGNPRKPPPPEPQTSANVLPWEGALKKKTTSGTNSPTDTKTDAFQNIRSKFENK